MGRRRGRHQSALPGRLRAETIPATAFTTSPDFAAIAASSRAAALSVSRAEDLPGVLEEAVSLIRTRRQSVLVDVQLAR